MTHRHHTPDSDASHPQADPASPLLISHDNRGVTTLTLNRVAVHNAFNAELVTALIDAFEAMHASPPRVLVLTGQGTSFSAGADLNWMQAMVHASQADNEADAKRLAGMFRRLDTLPCPTVARINGPAVGGGVGLIACCDIAVAAEGAMLGLSEVRLGLSPATIAPFVVAKIGHAHARRLMLTAERFDAQQARAIGLITDTTPADQLDGHVDDLTRLLLAGGPKAQAHTKAILRAVLTISDPQALDQTTAECIGALRVSEEGQEGLRAFLAKRPPRWAPPPPDKQTP